MNADLTFQMLCKTGKTCAGRRETRIDCDATTQVRSPFDATAQPALSTLNFLVFREAFLPGARTTQTALVPADAQRANQRATLSASKGVSL